jgi:beta-lactam-binding protein with PASTA domain
VDTYFDYWAKQTLVDSGFKVKVVYDYQPGYTNRGVTWATDPAMGTSAPEGSTVKIYATPKELKQPRV